MKIQTTRRACLLVAFFVGTLLLFGGSDFATQNAAQAQSGTKAVERPIREFRGRTMGTTYMVKVAGAQGVDDDTLRFKVDGELRKVNDQMSTYLPSSEITKFNESKSTDWFDVSSEFASVVEAAQEIARKTDGAFDITIGPLVNAWSFGAAERTQSVPKPEKLAELRELVGYNKLEVRDSPPALRKQVPGLTIDLSSIAKGHGVDRIVSLLKTLGAEDVFVEVGGEVRTAGRKSSGPWRVGIQVPDVQGEAVMIAHTMDASAPSGNAMATSGDYRSFFTVDGKRYSHTIDPRTAAPVEHSLASVSVIAKTCMEADGWATALNVVGMDPALKIAQENGLHTLLVSRTTPEKFEMNGTGILQQYAEAAAAPIAQTNSGASSIITMAVLTFGVFAVLLAAMAVGVMFGRKSISGSCGGLASKTNEDGSTSCSLCSSPSDACKELRDKMAESKTAP